MPPLFDHRLIEPLSPAMTWEQLDNVRQKLFERLEMLTDFPTEEGEEEATAALLADDIQEVADQLKLMAALLPRSIRKAVGEGKVKRGGRTPVCALCHQSVKRISND
jgi:hypothetical protein